MKRTSAAVLALLFALPSQAVRLDRKAKADQLSPENYDPWVYKFSKENMDAFPQWHMEDADLSEPLGSIAQIGHKHKQHKDKKVKDVAERGMDEEVHGFVSEYTPPLNTRVRSTLPFIPNGSHPSAFEGSAFNEKKHKHKHHKKDVAERGMDEEVHGFVSEYTPPLNTRVRSTLPFIPNGSDPSAHEGAALNEKKHHHHKRPDVAERGMDEEVHGFVKEYTPPLNEWAKTNQPFVPNGSDPSAHDPSFGQKKHHKKNLHRKKPDIAERGMDEEVHGFVKEYTPPLNEWTKTNQPFVPNGSDPSAHDPSLSQQKHHHKHHKRDVAERGMDEEVHGFVWHAIPPLNTRVRSDDPFLPNGSDPSAQDSDGLSFSQHKHHHHKGNKDIAERTMDNHFVHPYANNQDVVEPTPNPWTRPYLPFTPNGGSNVYNFIGSRDIANKEVRPDVYKTVHEMLNPVAMGRFREPRAAKEPEDITWDDGPKPKEPVKEFKFVPPKEEDEDERKAKLLKYVEKGKKKHKEELAKQAKMEEGDDEYGPIIPKSKTKVDDEDAKSEPAEKKESKEDKEEAEKKEKAEKKEADDADKEDKEAAEDKEKKEKETKKEMGAEDDKEKKETKKEEDKKEDDKK